MPDKFFLDTNVFVYSFDPRAKRKQQRALEFIGEAMNSQSGVISYQVVQEFLNVATRNFATPMTAVDATTYLRTVLMPLCAIYPSLELYELGLQIAGETGYSFYDALVIAAALSADCAILYSEDLQDRQLVHGLAIRNPFAN